MKLDGVLNYIGMFILSGIYVFAENCGNDTVGLRCFSANLSLMHCLQKIVLISVGCFRMAAKLCVKSA